MNNISFISYLIIKRQKGGDSMLNIQKGKVNVFIGSVTIVVIKNSCIRTGGYCY